ncbi:hypothetical protein BT93_L0339 [Corymbia citriodora subsp. variegata]|uniref:Uncharacterized protein n=1 Tax=Corymbia citriodora subsp. variegata TaxID=360336 RepID=A0A8T0CRA8_CORYI|nr:hypothetical protein BT93_L0339 [Corymbia citriodora subsp. variegata]
MLHPLMAESSLPLGALVYFLSFGPSHNTVMVTKSQPCYIKVNLVFLLVRDRLIKV